MSWRRFLAEPSWTRLDVYGYAAWLIFVGNFDHSETFKRMGEWGRVGILLGSCVAMVLVVQLLVALIGRGRYGR